MAVITNSKIQLLITEEEMDTLIQALGTFRDPFSEDAVLTDKEVEYKERRISLAHEIRETLEVEAMNRYYEKEEIKVTYGR